MAKQGARSGQGDDKSADNVDKQERQTWTKYRRRTQGLQPWQWHKDSRRTAGGQQEDTRRTREGHRVSQRGQRTAAAGGELEDKRQEEDNGRTSAARGQEEDKTWTQSPDTEFRGAASHFG